ncbi:unnamed protein product [Gordionus sp. m RMFG-2023]
MIAILPNFTDDRGESEAIYHDKLLPLAQIVLRDEKYEYLVVSFIAILTIIMFPTYHNYFRVSFDLHKYKVNITNKSDMNAMVFTCLNLDGSEGYILYEICRTLPPRNSTHHLGIY